MDEHRREIDALVAQDGPVTFQNTIVALEESGTALRRVSTVFWSLISAHASEEYARGGNRYCVKALGTPRRYFDEWGTL